MGQENIPEVGQKRKHSPAARQVSSVNSLAKQSSQPRPTKPDYPSPLYSQPEDEPVLPTAEFKVEISTVSPDWSYLVGGEKVWNSECFYTSIHLGCYLLCLSLWRENVRYDYLRSSYSLKHFHFNLIQPGFGMAINYMLCRYFFDYMHLYYSSIRIEKLYNS